MTGEYECRWCNDTGIGYVTNYCPRCDKGREMNAGKKSGGEKVWPGPRGLSWPDDQEQIRL